MDASAIPSRIHRFIDYSFSQCQVTPLLLKYKREALEEGLPLIRPLWLVSGTDIAPMPVQDEFAIGNEIVVAPILERGQTTRDGKSDKYVLVVSSCG